MKRFRCGDVVPGCNATFHGTEDDVLSAVADHARRAHGVTSVPESLADSVRAAMTTA